MNVQRASIWLVSCFLGLGVTNGTCLHAAEPAHRVTVSLNGEWDIEDSILPDMTPAVYKHKVMVPGLIHSATPAFPDVDEYQTRQLLSDMVLFGNLSQADYDKTAGTLGVSHQQRNYFWYRRTFIAPAHHAVALLKVNKAQFGIDVGVNGLWVGEHILLLCRHP